ncbi:neural cell adhesion molecule 2-like isoform X2 [Centruroides vittatus]|uniref:neural cell adhesion molecule 2-like isoform X2 n=1 Tax=Centruroides vittatus TaxID=120091 RepID=UPI003510BA8A
MEFSTILIFYILLEISSSSYQPVIPEYQAVFGGKVVLPCNVSIRTVEEDISIILWYKGDFGVPIYTLDSRKSTLQNAKHFPSTELDSRAHFDVTSKIPRLVLDPVKIEDAGEYKCRVDYRRSRTVLRRLRLRVIVPPNDVIIKDEHGQRMRDIIGPYDEGFYLILICEAEGGSPPPSVTWWRGSTLLDDSYKPTVKGVVRNELTLKNLQRSFLMEVFSCQASNTNLTVPKTSSVILDLNLKPLEVYIIESNRPVSAGQEVKLVCESTGSRPPAHLSWWKDGKKLESYKESVSDDGNITTSLLTFTPSVDDNGKSLSCRADHPSLPNSGIADRWLLNVHYAPILNLALGANILRSKIKEGSDVYFECNIKANPRVTELGWIFDGKPLFSNTNPGIIMINQSLVLQKVKKDHRGHYRCIASNSEGEGKSKDVQLEVQYAPVCKEGQKILYGIGRDETVNVSCEVEADPDEVSFRWLLNNTAETVEIRKFTTNGTMSTVKYNPKSMIGYGGLYCWARNEIGVQKEPCIFRMLPASPPELVKSCRITNQTTTSFTIICEPGYDGGLKQQFYLEVYTSADKHLLTNLTSADVPLFDVSNLPSGTAFLLMVYSNNAKGRSNSVALMTSTLHPAERRTADREHPTVSPILGLLIGVVGALVLVAIAVVVVMKVQGKDSDPESNNQENGNGCNTPLKKDTDEFIERTVKGPDIIPPNNESQYISTISGRSEGLERQKPLETIFSSLGTGLSSDIKMSNVRREKYRNNDDIIYAELSLTNVPQSEVISKFSPSEYASIDFSKQSTITSPTSLGSEDDTIEVTCESPLVNNLKRKQWKRSDSLLNPTATTPL